MSRNILLCSRQSKSRVPRKILPPINASRIKQCKQSSNKCCFCISTPGCYKFMPVRLLDQLHLCLPLRVLRLLSRWLLRILLVPQGFFDRPCFPLLFLEFLIRWLLILMERLWVRLCLPLGDQLELVVFRTWRFCLFVLSFCFSLLAKPSAMSLFCLQRDDKPWGSFRLNISTASPGRNGTVMPKRGKQKWAIISSSFEHAWYFSIQK